MAKTYTVATPVAQTATNARMQARIAVVQQLRTEHKAARAAKALAAEQHNAGLQQIAALQLQVAQLQAQYGVAPKQGTARANSATCVPSNTLVTVAGVAMRPCKAAQALAAEHYPNRKAAIAAMLLAGINLATASTQYGFYSVAQRKASALVTH